MYVLLAALTPVQELLGAVGLLLSGLLALAGVVFTALRQGATADQAAEMERKVNAFEEQDRMLERTREEADRAIARASAAETRAEALEAAMEAWRRRALTAEEKVDKWHLGREGM